MFSKIVISKSAGVLSFNTQTIWGVRATTGETVAKGPPPVSAPQPRQQAAGETAVLGIGILALRPSHV